MASSQEPVSRIPIVTVTAAMVIIIVVASVFFVSPIFESPWWRSHEYTSYPGRFTEFIAGYEAGYLYPRWCPDVARGRGYAFFDFYPPGFFFLALAVREAAGVEPLLALKLAVALVTILGSLGMLLLVLQLTGGDRAAATAAAILYLYAPYRCTDLYVRGDLSEYAALAYLPFVFWGIERLVSRTERGRRVTGSLVAVSMAFFAISLTHAITGVLVGYVAAVYLLLRSLRLPRTRVTTTLSLGTGALFVGALLLGFWALPALVHGRFVQLDRLTTGHFDIRIYGAPPWTVLDVRTWGKTLQSYWGKTETMENMNGMSLSLGLPVAIALAAAFLRVGPHWLLRRSLRRLGRLLLPGEERLDTLRLWMWLTIVLIPLTWQGAGYLAVWHLPFARYAQFTWRLLLIVTLAGAVVGGLVVHHARNKGPARGWIAAMAFAALALGTVGHMAKTLGSPMDKNMLPLSREEIAASKWNFVANWEYLPAGVAIDETLKVRPEQAWQLVEGETDVDLVSSGYADYRFRVNARSRARLQVSQFCYPGWTARREGTGDEERLEVVAGQKGFLEVVLPPGEYDLRVHWQHTRTHWLGVLISLLGLAGLAAAPLANRLQLPPFAGWSGWGIGAIAPSATTQDVRKIVLIFFATTVPLWLLAYGTATVFRQSDLPGWGFPTTIALNVWGHWDAVRYLEIANTGYDLLSPWGGANTSWFPLYPMLIRFVAPSPGLIPLLDTPYPFMVGLVISLVCFFLALLVLFDLIAPWLGKRVALLAVLYLSIFPSALYFRAIYAESLFTLLVLLSYRAFVREKYVQCGVFGALAAMTRPAGIMLLPAFGATVLWQLARGQKRWPVSTLCIGLIAAGLGAVMFVQWHAVGDPLSFLHVTSDPAQLNRRITYPGWSLLDNLKWMRLFWDFRTGENVLPRLMVDDLVAVAGVAGALYFFWRYDFLAGCFSLCLFLPALMLSRPIGMIRYALPVFLFPVFLAEIGEKRPWFHGVWVFISSLLLSAYTLLYACGY